MEGTLDMQNIKSLNEIHPLMGSLFPNVEWVLSLPRDEGFTSDMECIRSWGYVFDFKVKTANVVGTNANMYGGGSGWLNQISRLGEVGKTLNVEEGFIFQANMVKIQEVLYALIQKKMDLTEPTLKIVRFAKYADLTGVEIVALFYITAASVCIDTAIHQDSSLTSIARAVNGFSLEDAVKFTNPTRKWVKAGLFSYFDDINPLTQSLMLKNEIAYLLAGFDVKESRLLQYGGTCVAEFLEEEKQIKKKLNGDVGEEEKEDTKSSSSFVVVDENKQPEGEEEEDLELDENDQDEEMEKEPLNIHDFLRQEVELEREAALLIGNDSFVGPDGLSSDPFSSKDKEEEEEELKPYTDNLEYLED
eukprot:Awhi_evm1s11570